MRRSAAGAATEVVARASRPWIPVLAPWNLARTHGRDARATTPAAISTDTDRLPVCATLYRGLAVRM